MNEIERARDYLLSLGYTPYQAVTAIHNYIHNSIYGTQIMNEEIKALAKISAQQLEAVHLQMIHQSTVSSELDTQNAILEDIYSNMQAATYLKVKATQNQGIINAKVKHNLSLKERIVGAAKLLSGWDNE